MDEISRIREEIETFLNKGVCLDGGTLSKIYQDIDQRIKKYEQTVFERSHNLMLTQNLTYGSLEPPTGDIPSMHQMTLPALVRDSAQFLIDYRKLIFFFRKFYRTAAAFLLKKRKQSLSSNADYLAELYSSRSILPKKGTREIEHTVIPGWYERHGISEKDNTGIVAVDNLNGDLIKIQNHRVTPLSGGDLENPISDLCQCPDHWYIFSHNGCRVTITDRDFRVLKSREIGMEAFSITHYFTKGDNLFFCVRNDHAIHVYNEDFDKVETRILPGADALRKPLIKDKHLCLIHRPKTNVGCSEVLLIHPERGALCQYAGLDNPMILESHNDRLIVDDRLGIHFIKDNRNHCHTNLLFFNDFLKDGIHEPYCNGIKFSNGTVRIFLLDNEDFLTSKEIAQHIYAFISME